MGNTACKSLNLPFIIALYQVKENDTRIIIPAFFFKRYGLKAPFWLPFFLLRMGSTAGKVFDLPLGIA